MHEVGSSQDKTLLLHIELHLGALVFFFSKILSTWVFHFTLTCFFHFFFCFLVCLFGFYCPECCSKLLPARLPRNSLFVQCLATALAAWHPSCIYPFLSFPPQPCPPACLPVWENLVFTVENWAVLQNQWEENPDPDFTGLQLSEFRSWV